MHEKACTNPAETWIPLCEAAKLVPSPRPGRGTHLSTLYRWVKSGRLEARRNGRWLFVRREDVLGLLQPVPVVRPRPPEPPPPEAHDDGWAMRVLREARII